MKSIEFEKKILKKIFDCKFVKHDANFYDFTFNIVMIKFADFLHELSEEFCACVPYILHILVKGVLDE